MVQRAARSDIDLVSCQVVQRFQHQTEGFVGLGGQVFLEHGHGPSDQYRLRLDRLDLRWKELPLKTQFVHDITQYCGEEFFLHEREQFCIIFPFHGLEPSVYGEPEDFLGCFRHRLLVARF